MKKILYFMITINMILLSSLQASEYLWTDEQFRRIAGGLRDDPEALTMFVTGATGPAGSIKDQEIGRIARGLCNDREVLTMFITGATGAAGPIQSSLGYESTSMMGPMGVETVEEDLINYAKRPQRDLIKLTASDIMYDPNAHNSKNVVEIDLSDLHQFDGDDTPDIARYFMFKPLCNLKVLTLPAGNASRFIDYIFNDNDGNPKKNDYPQRKYFSLSRIIGHSSGVTAESLDTIFTHFSGYTDFVRDMHQSSGRYSCNAAFLSVENTGIRDLDRSWIQGRKADRIDYPIHYRVESDGVGSFIMSVSR